jgi:hypothetical protein
MKSSIIPLTTSILIALSTIITIAPIAKQQSNVDSDVLSVYCFSAPKEELPFPEISFED